ncbi:MAG: hypothetical protein RMK29_11455 [Myxococcales bacterium]|nr:hypothetical protein [Myxococcales bacterium]
MLCAIWLGVTPALGAEAPGLLVLGVRKEGGVLWGMTAAVVERLQRRLALGDRLLVHMGSCGVDDLDCLVRAGREQGASLVVQAEVVPMGGDQGRRDHEVVGVAVALGRVMHRVQQRCQGCDEAALEDRVAEALGALIEAPARPTHPSPPTHPLATQPAAQPAPPITRPPGVPPQPDEGKPLRIAGAVLLAVGATLAVGGLLLQVGHHLGWGRTVAESPSDSSLCWPGTQTGQWCLEPWVAPLVSGGGCFWQAGGAGSCWG